MKKKIAILGSTGSIGRSLLNLISKDIKNYKILLLTAHKNYGLLIKQAKLFKVRNIIITDNDSYKAAKAKYKDTGIKIFNNFDNYEKIFTKKIDYVMSSIVGLEGLTATYKIIKFTKKIAIANKETIICAWDLIKKQLIKYNTVFVPVDSEHFSIWYALNNNNDLIEKIYLTASGGSLLNVPLNKMKNMNIKKILKHPNWKMGKKITVDSSTLMNKVFEVIEAKKIFDLEYDQIEILIHPFSYVHAILQFNDGMIKIVAHDTTMKIPIFNTLKFNNNKLINLKKINFKKLNNLDLHTVNKKKFPSVKLLKLLPKKNSLFETVIVSCNDELVKKYLKKSIKYNQINSIMNKIVKRNEFKKYKKMIPSKISDVINLSDYVRYKINALY